MRLLFPLAIASAAWLTMAPCRAAPSYDGRTPMVEVGTVWMDPEFSPVEQGLIVDSVPKARARVLAFYGVLKSPVPDMIVCKSAACRTYFAGNDTFSFAMAPTSKPRPGGQYIFPRPSVVITYAWPAQGAAEKLQGTMTHEMSHTEMRARLGRIPIPPWFNEGVATYLGDNRRCAPGLRGVDSFDQLATQRQWNEYMAQDKAISNAIYCQSVAAVKAWLAARGGSQAVVALLDGLAAGGDFDALLQPTMAAPVVQAAATPAQAR